MHRAKVPVKIVGNMRIATSGRPRYGKKHGLLGRGSDLVQKMCSGYARQRMGPKLINFCKPEQVGTKEYGKMLKQIQVLEEGRILANEARNRKIVGHKRRITRT